MQRRKPDGKDDLVRRAFEFVPGHIAERLQNAGRRRCRRPSPFGENRQPVDSSSGHGPADRPFDEGIDHHRQKGRMNQARDPAWFLEVDRRDAEFGLEEGMAFFDVGLILVDEKDPFAGGCLQVCDQGEDAVGPGFSPKGGLVPGYRKRQPADPELPKRRSRPGSSPVGMAGLPDLPAVQADLQERRTPAAAEDRGDLGAHDGPLFALAAVKLGGEIVEFRLGLPDIIFPGRRIENRLPGTPAPDDPMPFARLCRPFDRGPIDIGRIVFFPPVFDDQGPAPPYGVPFSQEVAHRLVFGPGPRQDGDELSPVALQIGQILTRAELAVGHVDELVASQKPAEPLEVAPVDRIVGPVPAVDLVGDRDGAVGRDVEAEDQLLEVGPAGLRVSMGDPGFPDAPFIAAVERHRGRVVMDAADIELELFDDVNRHVKKQTFSFGRGEGVQSPGDPVVVERAFLRFGQSESFGGEGFGPLGNAVKRSRRQKNVPD